MLLIYPDVPMTKRKRMHHVTDDQAQLLWSGNRLIEALEYCWDQGHETVEIVSPARGMEHRFLIRVQNYRSKNLEQKDIEPDRSTAW